MQTRFLSMLVCPVTRSPLRAEIFSYSTKKLNGQDEQVVWEGMLFSQSEWFYPIFNGIPRLLVEAFLDYEEFCKLKMQDYELRKNKICANYKDLLRYTVNKNARTKKSFELEWSIFDYEKTKTWNASQSEILERFLEETNETRESLSGKWIFDAGCGNGYLNQFIAASNAVVVGMDLSKSVERAFHENQESQALFIQGDVQFPPLPFHCFDIVHSSGVLICTNNTELSFSCIEPCVKNGGKLSIWLYHPRNNFIHQFFNWLRKFTSRLPLRIQYILYCITIFPMSFVVKRLKGNKQSAREMMIDILDWFTPEYRWEHTEEEVRDWYTKRDYETVKVTTRGLFGFNIVGWKKK